VWASALASPSFAGGIAAPVVEPVPVPVVQQVPVVQTVAAVQSLAAQPLAVIAQQASLSPSEWPYFAGEAAMQETAVRALRWAFYAPNGYRWEYSGILFIH
jgi:hypothetical protein